MASQEFKTAVHEGLINLIKTKNKFDELVEIAELKVTDIFDFEFQACVEFRSLILSQIKEYKRLYHAYLEAENIKLNEEARKSNES